MTAARINSRQRLIAALEQACGAYDRLTHRLPGAVQARLPYCPLSRLSLRLDERWQTGCWLAPDTAA